MRPLRTIGLLAVLLWLAGGCQQGLAPFLTFGGVGPDFLLVVMVAASIHLKRRGNVILGFLSGVIHGGLAGANLAAYAVSRTFVGFCLGWVNDLELEPGAPVIFVLGAVATIGAQLLLMFIAPPQAIPPFLLATIGSAVVNGVLASALSAILRRFLGPPRD
jgi:cell shape-determining protein MreD